MRCVIAPGVVGKDRSTENECKSGVSMIFGVLSCIRWRGSGGANSMRYSSVVGMVSNI